MTAAERTPPYAIEAEQSVLGLIMLDNGRYHEASAVLAPETFYRADHQLIFAGMGEMIAGGKACDFGSLADFFRMRGQDQDVGGIAYLGHLQHEAFQAVTFPHHVELIADRARRRLLIQLAGDIAARAYKSGDETDDLVADVGAKVNAALTLTTATSVRFQAGVTHTEGFLRELRARRAAGGLTGAPTGLPSFDRLLGGFSGPRLYFIAARPKCGKSAFLNQFGIHAASKGFGGLIFTRELTVDEVIVRGMSMLAAQNVTKLGRGYHDEFEKAIGPTRALGDIPLWIDDETANLEQICAQAYLHKARHNIAWVAVDHVGLIGTRERFSSRNDLLGHITWTLKQLAKRLKIPVIALSQLSRRCDVENRKPRPDDTRDTGNIEQDADAVIMLHVPMADRDEPIKPVEIGIPANRTGPGIWLKGATFEFHGQYQTFREIFPETESEDS